MAQLASEPGRIFSKSELMDAVWPDVTVSDENLTQCVAEIRKALSDTKLEILQTHVGRGYSINVTLSRNRSRHLGGLAIVAVLAASLAAAAIWFMRPAVEQNDPPRIAVLAFDDLSSGTEKGWLGDGIAEGLITELAWSKELQVIARNSSFSFRDQSTDVREIAEALNADYIVEGSKQKSGNQMRITAQLLEGRSGSHIWAHEYDADIGELFEVQSQIVQSIALQIGREVFWGRAPRPGGREAVTALDLFVQGNEAFKKRTSEERARSAELFTQSIAADPTQPFGYTGMATLMWAETSNPDVYPDLSVDEVLARGFDYAESALEADSNYYRSHIAMGDMHNAAGDMEAALSSYLRAAELNPSNGEALVLAAEPLLYLDRADEAVELMERAYKVNPIVPGWYRNIHSRSLWWAGRCEEGVETIQKLARMATWDHRAKIMNLVCLDRMDEARNEGQKLLKLDPDFTVSAHENRVKGIMPPKYAERWLANLRAAGLPE